MLPSRRPADKRKREDSSLSNTENIQMEAKTNKDDAATAASVVVVPHANYLSFISTRPFRIVEFRRGSDGGSATTTSKVFTVDTCSVSVDTSQSDRLKFFDSRDAQAMKEMATGAATDKAPAAEVQIAILWCLHSECPYVVDVVLTGDAEKTRVCARTEEFERENLLGSMNPAMHPASIASWRVLFHPLVMDLIQHNRRRRLAAGSANRAALEEEEEDESDSDSDSEEEEESAYFYLFPPNPLVVTSMAPFLLRTIYYLGLFTLHNPLRMRGAVAHLFALPNSEARYVIDLAELRRRHRAGVNSVTSAEGSAKTAPSPAPAADIATTTNTPFTLHNRRVRRALRDPRLRLWVRTDAEGIAAGMRACAAYHAARGRGTWMTDDLVHLMSSCAVPPPADAGTAAQPPPPPPDQRVRLMVIELVRAGDGADGGGCEVLAGCCSFSLGALFHDYSMYTPGAVGGDDARAGYGSVLSRLLIDALYHCRYDMWYWGMEIAYMRDYSASYAARSLPRADFYERWVARRDTPWPGGGAPTAASATTGSVAAVPLIEREEGKHETSRLCPSFTPVDVFLRRQQGLLPCL